MELPLVQQGSGTRQGAMGQVLGLQPRQARRHRPIGQGLGHQGHEGRAGGGEGQEGIELALREFHHFPHPGEQAPHPLPAPRVDLAPGQAGEAGADQTGGVGYRPHTGPPREEGFQALQPDSRQHREQQGPLQGGLHERARVFRKISGRPGCGRHRLQLLGLHGQQHRGAAPGRLGIGAHHQTMGLSELPGGGLARHGGPHGRGGNHPIADQGKQQGLGHPAKAHDAEGAGRKSIARKRRRPGVSPGHPTGPRRGWGPRPGSRRRPVGSAPRWVRRTPRCRRWSR